MVPSALRATLCKYVPSPEILATVYAKTPFVYTFAAIEPSIAAASMVPSELKALGPPIAVYRRAEFIVHVIPSFEYMVSKSLKEFETAKNLPFPYVIDDHCAAICDCAKLQFRPSRE